MADQTAEEQLRQEVTGLPVEEILALCYALQNKPERLRLYLDVLRRKGGSRAQFACCLLCFDLARQGDQASQQEFIFLADTMRSLAESTNIVQQLIGEDPYLNLIWEMCEVQLEELDPRLEVHHQVDVDSAPEDLAVVDLFDDDEFEGIAFDVDNSELRDQFYRATDTFLGAVPGMPLYDPESGFRMRHRKDTERIETFLTQLDSLREHVPLSRGFRTLLLLFYGTRLRSKNLFGSTNDRKQKLLRQGLHSFDQSGPETWEVAGVLDTLHATPNAWPKMADIILDYLRWLHRQPENDPDLTHYDAVGRLVKRDHLRKKR